MAGLAGRTICCRRFVGKIRYLHTSRQCFDQYKCVAVNEVESFVERCMSAVGTPLEHCKALAQVLVAGDERGHFSHGLNRLEMYVHDINVGSTVVNGDPEIVKETSATAFVEGNNLLGPVVGNFCNDLAMKKAQETGIGWVACKGSNHYGIAGWYTIRAVEKGLIGMSFTNTSPLVVPTRARQSTLGTNPLSLAAPGKNGDSFVLDMATSAVALGKIEMADRKGVEIPHGWAVDSKGLETVNPEKVLSGGGQLPLGGTEITSGFKGYGLAMMVEVLCGILADAAFGPNVRKWKGDDRVANLGHCFVAVDPKAFSEGFEDRMQSLMDHCRNLQPAEGETAVLVAGDPERAHIQKVKEDGGIHYHVNLLEAMDKLADQLGVPCMPTK
ncbi:uncharacterized protein LOC111334150 isoform X1 [Stylophora pistillata]|uniref:uncharacterized protein LOC111334150 isoform X1 n=2 Tax=Stylophora pistillata TaxID=50429 RepID=UPI000C04A794|nr:uncharacterized protein LOC111334150 isoform X1 [Stylophora pistillata]